MFKKIFTVFMFLFIPVCAQASEIEVTKNDGIYVFKIPLDKYKDKIKPYVSADLTTVSEVFNKGEKYKLVVNGGFFDPINNLPVSEVVIDGKRKQKLFDNFNLVSSLNRARRLEKVFNRTEFRVLESDSSKLSFDIAPHFSPLADDVTIKHSIQAGPALLPEVRMEQESFIAFRENKPIQLAADVLKRRERTIVGLKKGVLNDGYLYIVIFSTAHKATLTEARDYCKELGLDKAMAMDGGASTSINYKDIEIYSCNDGERRVKSFLVIEN